VTCQWTLQGYHILLMISIVILSLTVFKAFPHPLTIMAMYKWHHYYY